MDSLGQICSAALQQYLAHGEARGLDIATALDTAALDAERIRQPDARIPGASFQTLLHTLIDQAGDPLFGLHTSEFVQPGSYNVMGYIAMSASTLHEALSKVSLYETLVGDMGTTDTRIADNQAAIRWDCRYTQQPAPDRQRAGVLGPLCPLADWQ